MSSLRLRRRKANVVTVKRMIRTTKPTKPKTNPAKGLFWRKDFGGGAGVPVAVPATDTTLVTVVCTLLSGNGEVEERAEELVVEVVDVVVLVDVVDEMVLVEVVDVVVSVVNVTVGRIGDTTLETPEPMSEVIPPRPDVTAPRPDVRPPTIPPPMLSPVRAEPAF